jgi:hypothetical protein
MEELRELGLNEIELAVLILLTRRPDETYRAYVMRIACASAEWGDTRTMPGAANEYSCPSGPTGKASAPARSRKESR